MCCCRRAGRKSPSHLSQSCPDPPSGSCRLREGGTPARLSQGLWPGGHREPWRAAHSLSPLSPEFGLTTAKVKAPTAQPPRGEVWPCPATPLLTRERTGHVQPHSIASVFPRPSSPPSVGRKGGQPAMRTRTTLSKRMEQQDGRTLGPAPAATMHYHVRQKRSVWLSHPLRGPLGTAARLEAH